MFSPRARKNLVSKVAPACHVVVFRGVVLPPPSPLKTTVREAKVTPGLLDSELNQ